MRHCILQYILNRFPESLHHTENSDINNISFFKMLHQHQCQCFNIALIGIIPTAATFLTSLGKLLLHHLRKQIYAEIIVVNILPSLNFCCQDSHSLSGSADGIVFLSIPMIPC